MSETFYRAVDVWIRRAPGALTRYRCFELLPAGGYCVQSADFYSAADPKPMSSGESQFLELLLEEAPDQRSEVYPTLEEAIQAHDREFQ